MSEETTVNRGSKQVSLTGPEDWDWVDRSIWTNLPRTWLKVAIDPSRFVGWRSPWQAAKADRWGSPQSRIGLFRTRSSA